MSVILSLIITMSGYASIATLTQPKWSSCNSQKECYKISSNQSKSSPFLAGVFYAEELKLEIVTSSKTRSYKSKEAYWYADKNIWVFKNVQSGVEYYPQIRFCPNIVKFC